MATLDDKLLGEKLHNYCSSSEGESEEESGDEDSNKKSSKDPAPPPPEINKWEGSSTNTGPKGVLKDWQRFKQLESEKREEQERERMEIIKRLSMTCRSHLDDEREKAKEDPELAELLDDDFLYEYQKQRMQEMMMKTDNVPIFGKLISLTSGDEFLDAVDKENKNVNVIVHIYEDHVPACRVMNECLKELSKDYTKVKFCKIVGSSAGMSRLFKVSGVPALLVYKGGQIVGNFVRLTDELGDEFYPDEVQSFLIEHGMLLDKSCIPAIITSSTNDSDDSD